ncbi:MAG TPA: NDP-sugar synthase [Firmicutes bacterium]|nr:NDP-sugar synthase [Bacillota bacterium]
MKAMILAAGLGTRLRPLTNTVSKPMVPMAGRPCMEHIVSLLRKHGYTDIIANLHYLPEQIKGYFGDGSRFGVKLSYSLEEELLGTAGGLKKVQDFFGNESFLVISGDALTDIDLSEFLSFHKATGGLASLALKEVTDPSRFGVVLKNEAGLITAFQEKPAREEAISNLANTGIYLFEPAIFSYIPPQTFYDFARDVFPRLLADGKRMPGYETNRYWCDVGNLETYRESQAAILTGAVQAEIPAALSCAGGIFLGGGVKLSKEADVTGPCYIGNGCVIEEGACITGPAVLGPGLLLRRDAMVTNSIFWGGGEIGAAARVADSIIGYGVSIPAGAKVAGEVRESLATPGFVVAAAAREK